MPYKDPEVAKQKKHEYYIKNKAEINAKNKINADKNKDAKREYDKLYRERNKEIRTQQDKDYAKTDKGKRVRKINTWKHLGIINDDFDALYDKYINTNECELCKISITEGQGLIGKKHLDHDHETKLFRNILCGYCNINVLRKK